MAETEEKLQYCREQFMQCSQEVERSNAELQRCRNELIARSKELQLERDSRARQVQELRLDLKTFQLNQNESREFMEGRTKELQETIRQLVESERQLAEARKTLDRAADLERQRISDGLHSGPVHKLSEALLDLDAFLETVKDNGSLEQLYKIRADLEDALRSTDQAVHQLKPVELKRGLLEGLKSLLFRTFPNRQLAKFIAPRSPVDFGLDEASQIILYRYVHEALNNVQKHGKNSTKIEIAIDDSNDYLNLAISNHFPNESADEDTTDNLELRPGGNLEIGHGLHNMQAYAVLLGASLDKHAGADRFELRLRKKIER